MPSLKLSNPFRRGVTRPSLKERAAGLKATAARVRRRGHDAGTDQGRRAIVAGSLAAALPLPALAASSSSPHPDAALLAAGALFERTRMAEKLARNAARKAHEPIARLLDTCPPELILTIDENKRLVGWQWPTRLGCHVRHIPPINGVARLAWTGEALRLAIKRAVPLLGRGGQTPFRIKRWHSLLPLADALDAQVAALEVTTSWPMLVERERQARAEAQSAELALNAFVASTPEGLAVLTRMVGRYDWKPMGGAWPNLLRSAAAVSGVDLATVHALRDHGA